MHPLLRSVHAEIIVSAALAIAMLVVTTALHYESLRVLTRASSGRVVSHAWVVIILAALIGVHLTEVVLYAGVYAIGSKVLGLGALHGSTDRAALDFFYFAAETYSTLGYGDLIPVGSLRLVANVEALNGLLLLSCSGAFLFGVLRDGSLQQSHPQDAMESRQAVRSRKCKCGRWVRQPRTAPALSRLPDRPRHGHGAIMRAGPAGRRRAHPDHRR
jgi:Ion channel